jgi:hypothetical protein
LVVLIAVGRVDEVAAGRAVVVEDEEDGGLSMALRVDNLWRGVCEWVG